MHVYITLASIHPLRTSNCSQARNPLLRTSAIEHERHAIWEQRRRALLGHEAPAHLEHSRRTAHIESRCPQKNWMLTSSFQERCAAFWNIGHQRTVSIRPDNTPVQQRFPRMRPWITHLDAQVNAPSTRQTLQISVSHIQCVQLLQNTPTARRFQLHFSRCVLYTSHSLRAIFIFVWRLSVKNCFSPVLFFRFDV